MEKDRDYKLDCLRGIASMWIVLFHVNEVIVYEPNLYTTFAKYGHLGVVMFFVISGFCIALVVEKSKSGSNYFKRRWFRIYPPYLVSLLIVLLVIIIRKTFTGTNDVVSLPSNVKEILATLTIMTAPATSVKTMNWVYWTLTHEVAFYIVAGITIWFNHKRILFFSLISLLCFIPNIYKIPGLYFLSEWAVFGAGIGLCYCMNVKHKQLIYSFFLLFVNLVGVILTKPFADCFLIITTIIFIGIPVNFLKYFNRKTVLSSIGEASYGLYLLHVPVGCYLLLRYREGIWLNNLLLHILYDFVVLAICIAISLLFFRYIELPSIAMGKKEINQKKLIKI